MRAALSVLGVWAALGVAGCSDDAGAPPAAPTDLVAALEGDAVRLTWTDTGGASRVEVLRSEVSARGFTVIGSVSAATLTYADPLGPARPPIYYYVVRAVGPGGPSGNSNQVKVTLGAAAREALQVVEVRPQTIRLAWAADPLADHYQLWTLPQSQARAPEFDASTFTTRGAPLTGSEFELPRAPGDNLLVAVQALDARGARWISNVVTAPGGPVAGPLHVASGDLRVQVAWAPLATTPPGTITEVTGYQLTRDGVPVAALHGVDLTQLTRPEARLALTVPTEANGVPADYAVTTLVADGEPGLSTPPVAGAGRAWTRVAGNEALTCAIGSGELFCFQTRPPALDDAIDEARNPFGLLGNGTRVAPEHRDLVAVPGLGADLVDVALGEARICALHGDGAVSCWGLPFDVTATSPEVLEAPVLTSPAPFHGAEGLVALAAGAWHTCGLHADGGVSCWGDNDQGQLGRGVTDAEGHPEPVRVPGLTGVTQLVAGYAHTCALIEGGAVLCWGAGASVGQDTSGADIPIPIGVQLEDGATLLTGIGQLSAAATQQGTCAIAPPSDVWCWTPARPLARRVSSRPGSDAYPAAPVEQILVGGWTDEGGTTELTLCADGTLWSTQWRDTPLWSSSGLGAACTAMTANAGHLCWVDALGFLACRGADHQIIFQAED